MVSKQEKNESKEVIEMNQDFYQAYLDPPDALNDDIKPPKPGAAHRSPSILDKSSYQDQKRFLLDLAMAFHLWGAPAYYTEAKVAAAGYSFGTKNFKKCVFKRNIPRHFIKIDIICEPFVMYTIILLSFNDFENNEANSETHILRVLPSLDASRLSDIDQLGKKTRRHRILRLTCACFEKKK